MAASDGLGEIKIDGVFGLSAHRRVFLGFALSNLLHSLSFADILDEETGRGYQRRFNPRHSLDFRRYIQHENSSTIPLTFNLRPTDGDAWRVVELGGPRARLEISARVGKVFAQVDCQHRLGHLNDLPIPLPFMCFLGLTVREEMDVFGVINGKAKGLSTSLLDFHEAQLANDLAVERPELFIALNLNNDARSPWHRQLDLGGNSTSGLTRRASLRTMQKAVKRFLALTKILRTHSVEAAAQVVLDFWAAAATILPDQWSNPRKHLVTKGIGVYALMDIAGDLYNEARDGGRGCDKRYFENVLSEFIGGVDWTSDGPLKGFGGEGGVKSAVELIRGFRKTARFSLVSNG